MVFGLFKKKKKVPQDGAQETTKPEKVSKSSKTKEKTPKNSKQTPKTETQQHPTEPQRVQDDNEDQWKYESIIQFLQSPLWRIPLVEFVDEHCFVFDNPKEDKPEYIEIHESYKKMVERLVEEMLSELEIEIEKFTEIVHAGVNDPTYKKTFEQFLTVDNFTVFKKIMFKRNKELELEALQQLHEIDKQKALGASGVNSKERERLTRENEQDIQKLIQEKEEAELEHALALSLAVEEERQKLIEQEDYELQEAMRQSEIEYSRFQRGVREKEEEIEREKQAKQEELERYEQEKRQREELHRQQRERELAKEQEIARIHAEEVARKKSQENEQPKSLSELVEEEKIEHRPEETKSQELDRISRKKLEPLKNAPKPSTPELAEQKKSSIFPPIKGSADYDPMADYTAETEKKPVKHEIKDETLEERKKRLQAQRDLILAKKKAEREAELKSYEARRESVTKPTTQKNVEDVSKLEIMRRKEIYGKLKNEF